jgi:DNA-binding GntR family transcriptional regulator
VAGIGSRLSDLAYARLLEALFEGRLPAGSFVSQSDLAKLVDVSVVPLRDALRTLEAEGILTIHPRTGIQFVEPGLELTRATYQFRGIVESVAVAHFAETASDSEIDEIERRHQAMILHVGGENLDPSLNAKLEELEDLLHGSIVGSLNNPLINTSYRRVRNYVRLIRVNRRLTRRVVLNSLREHIAIIDACRQRNPTDAIAALQAHFAAALLRSLGLN